MSDDRTCYEILEVSRAASREDIRRAYLTQARRYMDARMQATLPPGSWRSLNAALETLDDPARRQAYDATLPAATTLAPIPETSVPAAPVPPPVPPLSDRPSLPAATVPLPILPTTAKSVSPAPSGPSSNTIFIIIICCFSLVVIGISALIFLPLFLPVVAANISKPRATIDRHQPTPPPNLAPAATPASRKSNPAFAAPPEAITLNLPHFSAPEITRPASGILFSNKEGKKYATLEISTDPGLDYFIILTPAEGGSPELIAYLTGGDPLTCKLPTGSYELRYASGDSWYGKKYFFGPRATYFKIAQPIDLKPTRETPGYEAYRDALDKLGGVEEDIRQHLLDSGIDQKTVTYIFDTKNPKTQSANINTLDASYWRKNVAPKISSARNRTRLTELLDTRNQIVVSYNQRAAELRENVVEKISLTPDGDSDMIPLTMSTF
ncbi:hypothetical protein DB345_03440 [Spartobacteria bacterium LR76]|nr:hypothetical protein DB345_03440 [Spartobacteria bacterium LR76]